MDVDQPATDVPSDASGAHQSLDSGNGKPTSAAVTADASDVPVATLPGTTPALISAGEVTHEQVPDILEEPPMTNLIESLPTPKGSEGQKPSRHIRALVQKNKCRGKVKVGKVVFGQQKRNSAETTIATSHAHSADPFSKDYLTPLFVQNFSQQSKWMRQIDQLVFQSHKAISTHDVQTAVRDNQACKVLKRVFYLQQHDKWSLRQPERCPEPVRTPSHWDLLLQEMKWMRADFRGEGKWKRAAVRRLALSCAEWVAASAEERKALQVNTIIPPRSQAQTRSDTIVVEGNYAAATTPELASSGDSDSLAEHDEEGLGDGIPDTVAPSLIFAMPDDEVVFALRRSAAADQLFDQLPMYGSPLKVPQFDLAAADYDPDSHWRRPALPLSKYAEGEMRIIPQAPPSKRSRYRYSEDEEVESEEQLAFSGELSRPPVLERENKDVALFDPEMKPMRDRLHAGHQFRPPTEHPMPLQSFYECWPASQWTWVEDDQLKALVREHSYNWSLISGLLSSKSMFVSGAERRTPWECFERWVNLEGLPNDMSKTQYFKTYQNRIDAAQRAIQDHNNKVQQQQQQHPPTGPSPPGQRRRSTNSIRVDKRRTQKHLALIDAMRKLAKKRETAIQKQQYTATLSAARRANEQPQPRGPMKTPIEYSEMRWERDTQLAEKMAQYAQRHSEVQRRVRYISDDPTLDLITDQAVLTPNQQQLLAARSQGQAPVAAGGPTPVPPQVAGQMAANPLASAARANVVAGQLAVPGQARARMPLQAPPNAMAGVQAHLGGALVPPLPMNGMSQAQQIQAMQAQHRMQIPNPQADMQLVLQARRIQDQQRVQAQLQQQQQQQQQVQQHQVQQQGQASQQPLPQAPPGTQVSLSGMRGAAVNGINQQSFMANAQALMAPFNGGAGAGAGAGGAGMGTPGGSALNMPSVVAGSPRANAALPQQLPPAMITQLRELEASFKAKNPQLTPEQARTMAFNNYQQILMLQRQTAMASASGGTPQQALVNGMAGTSPHQYAQLLRAQQQVQAQAAAVQQPTPHQRQPSSGAAPVPKG